MLLCHIFSLQRDWLAYIFDDKIPAKILSDGSVGWAFPIIIKSSCNIDISNYPFDTQVYVKSS